MACAFTASCLAIAAISKARAQADSVVTFNELHYHPADAAAPEWVELHNQMAVRIDVSGWRLGGGIDFTFPEGSVLEPGSCVVVAGGSGVSGAVGVFAGRLDNAGETITLRGRHGRLMDELEYSDDHPWPIAPDGGGVTLAKVRPDSASGDPASWTWSGQAGGTPGQENFPPHDAPAETALIRDGDAWDVWIGAAGAPPAEWTEPGFDAGGWMSGAGVFASSPVINPSFEAETFTVSPGYISSNSPISGWTAEENGAPGGESSIGVNTPGAMAPFANNGRVPDGGNAAFIRGGAPRALVQSLRGLRPGKPFILRYRENARNPTVARPGASVDGAVVVAEHELTSVDSLGVYERPYRHAVSRVFSPAGAGAELRLFNRSDATGTALFDDVSIDPVRLHDRFASGAEIDGRTAEDGAVGAAWSAAPPDGASVTGGALLRAAAPCTATLPLALTPSDDVAVIGAKLRAPQTAGSEWSGIGFTRGTDLTGAGVLWAQLQANGTVVLHANESGGAGALGIATPGGAAPYPFSPDDWNTLHLVWDREARSATVLLNGATVFNEYPLSPTAGGIDGEFAPAVTGVGLTLRTAGVGADDFFVAANESANVVLPAPPPEDRQTSYYFRRDFTFDGDPAGAALILTLAQRDGAAVSLNGEEIHRANLPDGALAPDTPALDAAAGQPQALVLPADALRPGANTLAVEVHTAAGNPGGALFSAQLSALAFPPRPGLDGASILLSEIGGADGGDGFFVELMNIADAPASLQSLELVVTEGSGEARAALPDVDLPPGGFFVADADAFAGIVPAEGSRIFLKRPDGSVIDAATSDFRTRARIGLTPGGPADRARWQTASVRTPGSANVAEVSDAVVISEFLYHHRPTYPDPGAGIDHAENHLEWIEFHNRSGGDARLDGWTMRGGADFDFPAGTVIPAGDYLVVTGSLAAFSAAYPGIPALGNFSGGLSNRTDRIELRDPLGNTADRVVYHDGGTWPRAADGRGSSLELIDSHTDNSSPTAWAASLESARAEWHTIRYRGRAAEPPGSNNPSFFNELLIGLLDDGEALIDDVSVVEDPGGSAVEVIQNGSFEVDSAGSQPAHWRILGTHRLSEVVPNPDGAGRVLRLVATDRLEHSYNVASTTFAGSRPIRTDRDYEISFRAKWITGTPMIHSRLYFNRLSRTHVLAQPPAPGTPGAPNSTRVANAGPNVADLAHDPVVPADAQPVRIRARVSDPDGIANARVFFRSAGTWQSATMSREGDGDVWLGVIPGHGAGTIVPFHIAATDARGASSIFPREGTEAGTMFRVAARHDADDRPVHLLRIIMRPEDAAFMHTSIHTPSNFRWPATVIWNDREVFYGCGARLRGSAYGRRGARLGWNIRFPDGHLFRGVHQTVAIDGGYAIPNGQGNGWRDVGPGVATNELVYNQIAHRAGGVPATYDDIGFIEAPLPGDDKLAQLKMARFGDIFLDSSFEDGGDGPLFKYELVYHPTGTVDGSPESLKDVYNAVLGVDIGSMTVPDKEAYRHNFWVQNHSDRDSYERVIDLNQAFAQPNSQLRAATDAVIDVDNWMRVLAFQALTTTVDSYNNGLPHNLLLYVRPADNKVMAFPWDVDHAFYDSPAQSIFGRASHRASDVIQIPENRRLYLGHLIDFVRHGFDPSYIGDWIGHYNELAETPAASHYTQWIAERRSHVLSAVPQLIPPTQFHITTNGGNDFAVSAAFAELAGRGWVDVRGIRLGSPAGTDFPAIWSGDTAWRVSVPLASGANEITLVAVDHQGAEVGRDTITITNSGAVEAAAAGNLAVSEMMYHPAPPSAAEIAAGFTDAQDFEFLELMNIGARHVTLAGAALTEGIGFAFDSSAPTLAPGDRIVLARSAAAFAARYGAGIPVAGSWQNSPAPGGSRLSNGGETIRILDARGNVIRQFAYDDQPPWPSGADGSGFSLTLISPPSDPDHADARSWRASGILHGSPGNDDADSLAAWMDRHGESDPNSDSNRDGLTAFAAYAFGADLAIERAAAASALDPLSGGELRVSFRIRGTADDVSYTLETSRDGASWDVDPASARIIKRELLADGRHELTFELTGAGSPNRLARLRAEIR